MAILDDVKVALRIAAATTAYDGEIEDLIDACEADLGLCGLTSASVVDTDPLIKRAIVVYVKANFGYDNPDAERLQRAYELLKNHLSLSVDYGFFAVTFTVTDADTEVVIRSAEVTFDDETKTTDESGQAVFYKRAGNNYEYMVEAEDYESDDDDDNLIDVSTAAVAVAISLTAL